MPQQSETSFVNCIGFHPIKTNSDSIILLYKSRNYNDADYIFKCLRIAVTLTLKTPTDDEGFTSNRKRNAAYGRPIVTSIVQNGHETRSTCVSCPRLACRLECTVGPYTGLSRSIYTVWYRTRYTISESAAVRDSCTLKNIRATVVT